MPPSLAMTAAWSAAESPGANFTMMLPFPPAGADEGDGPVEDDGVEVSAGLGETSAGTGVGESVGEGAAVSEGEGVEVSVGVATGDGESDGVTAGALVSEGLGADVTTASARARFGTPSDATRNTTATVASRRSQPGGPWTLRDTILASPDPATLAFHSPR